MNESAIHPIIYVRGYAMTQSEIEDTVADPYMGFNIGSCKVRQLWDGKVKKYFFESPLVRLLKQFGYDDVYEDGSDRVRTGAPTTGRRHAFRRAVPQHRHLPLLRAFVRGPRSPAAARHGAVRAGVGRADPRRCASGFIPTDLRHGHHRRRARGSASSRTTSSASTSWRTRWAGWSCRAFLQNPAFGTPEARALVDKVFTYATPHNGIEIGLLGNVPSWLALYGMNTFNRDEIARAARPVRPQTATASTSTSSPTSTATACSIWWAPIPATTRRRRGLSSVAVGEASDGLVRITNATTRARKRRRVSSPRRNAFVHRSHSGYFGIVNSEEGYQNLIRFLFGDVRADGRLEIDELTLPPAVQKQLDKKRKRCSASYLFEVAVSVRGKPWQLHRRTANENSAIFRKFDELFPETAGPGSARRRIAAASPMLFNVFLDMEQSQTGTTLAFAVDLCVRVPDTRSTACCSSRTTSKAAISSATW